MAKQLSPPPQSFQDDGWWDFFQGVQDGINKPKFYTKAGNPTTNEVPIGTWSMWLNTSTNTLRFWGNVAGVLRSVTLT